MAKKDKFPPEYLFPGSRKFRLEQIGNEVKITEEWSGRLLPILVLCSGLALYLFFTLVARASSLAYLIFFTGLGLIASYTVLAACLNKTVVTLSPEKITSVAGPLPWPVKRSWQLQTGPIHQLKAVNKLLAYELQANYGQQRERVVLFRMLEEAAAFYLEEEISDYLGLPLPAEPLPLPKQYKKQEWAKLYHFAQQAQLRFRVSKFTATPVLSGLYQGCQLKINFFRRARGESLSLTRFHLSVAEREVLPLPELDQSPTSSQVAQFLEEFMAGTLTHELPGKLRIEPGGQNLVYQEFNLPNEATSLQPLCETLTRFLKVYPRLANLGGLAVPLLQSLAKRRAFQRVAIQLLHDISKETSHRLGDQAAYYLCPTCLQRCTAQKIAIPGDKLTYYGCRACRQSLEFLPVEGRVIALLDRRMSQKYKLQGQLLYGNWLLHRQPFDFDEVYIRQASDEEVEHFAIQVGNDTDPVRRPRYARVRCVVWSSCGLSENSLKILERTFGRVEIKAQDSQKRQDRGEISASPVSRLAEETEEKTAEDTQ